MSQNYLQIRNDYLQKAWARSPGELAVCLPATEAAGSLQFRAFGEDCLLAPDTVTLGGKPAEGPEGLLIALYASVVPGVPVRLKPLKSFKELPGTMPYQQAFSVNAEQILVPQVASIHLHQESLVQAFSGQSNTDAPSGDFSFTLYPLPRVPLYYIFYLADEEFPAAVTCLFAANAAEIMPVDGLADVAEYTARKMLMDLAARPR